MESGSEIWWHLAWEEVAVSINGGRWGEGVLALLKHGMGIGRGKAAQLGPEIKEDRVRLPVAKGANGSLVDARDEEGGGTPGPEAVGLDAVGGGDVGDMVDGSGSAAEGTSDVAGGDIVGPASGVIVLIQGSVGGGGGEGTEVFNVVAEGADRA